MCKVLASASWRMKCLGERWRSFEISARSARQASPTFIDTSFYPAPKAMRIIRAFRNSFYRRFSQTTISSEPSVHDPLRILFCGSDEFSTTALTTVDQIRERNPSIIESVEVLCRPAKKVGRGLKHLKHPPIYDYAYINGIPIHEVDDFKDWKPREWNFNLIVAVSFGLFIPRKLIEATKYGGLNVHPSVLPDLAGAAPLHHALLNGDTVTGVTLQTLDSSKFDAGKILLQRRSIPIHNAATTTIRQFQKYMAPFGAAILRDGIMRADFVPPIREIEILPLQRQIARRAPKITKQSLHIIWKQWDAREIVAKFRVLGPLWNEFEDYGGKVHRLILSDIAETSSVGTPKIPVGVPFAWKKDHSPRLLVWTKDNRLIQIGDIKLQSRYFQPARVVASSMGFLDLHNFDDLEKNLIQKFSGPLT